MKKNQKLIITKKNNDDDSMTQNKITYTCILSLYMYIYIYYICTGFGFLSFDNEESIYKVVAEHFVTINGKQVNIIIIINIYIIVIVIHL